MRKYFDTWWKNALWFLAFMQVFYLYFCTTEQVLELDVLLGQAAIGWVVQYFLWWGSIRAIHAAFIYAIFAKSCRFSMVRILHSSTGKIARNFWIDLFRINKQEMRILQKMCLLLTFIN